jgi:hypothetical protein
MLEKYKQTAATLSARQLQKLIGGTEVQNQSRLPSCQDGIPCPWTCATLPPNIYYAWECRGTTCHKITCLLPD